MIRLRNQMPLAEGRNKLSAEAARLSKYPEYPFF